MSIQDLPKTLVITAVKLVRIPLELIERAIPGRGSRPPASERLEPDPGIDDHPTPDEGLRPDPDAPKPKRPARKPTAKRDSSTAKKPPAKKSSSAKKPAAKRKPATKRSTPKPKNTTAAEEPGVVDEATDGLGAATDRAVKARGEIEQAAEASGDRR